MTDTTRPEYSPEQVEAVRARLATWVQAVGARYVVQPIRHDDVRTILSALAKAEGDSQRLALCVWADSAHRGPCGASKGECRPGCPRGIAQRVLETAPREARGWNVKHPNADYWLCALHKEVVHGPGTAYASCTGCDAIDAAMSKERE